MTVSNNNAIDLKALLYALTQQPEPLPETFQHSLQKAGQALQQNQPEAAHQLRESIKLYAPLEAAYKSALQQFDKQYSSQQRTKSLSAAFQNTAGLDWLFIHDVIPTTDWVATAKQVSQAQQAQAQPTHFWDKTDRMAVMIAGGVALGTAIAQVPGAIVGGMIGASYGWYIGFGKKKSAQNS